MPKLYRFFPIFLFLTILLTACGGGTGAPAEGQPGPGISVEINGSACPSINASVGDQVTWVNRDSEAHLIRVISSGGERLFEGGDLQPGDSASFTFPEAGEFTYQCAHDEGVTGSIVVGP